MALKMCLKDALIFLMSAQLTMACFSSGSKEARIDVVYDVEVHYNDEYSLLADNIYGELQLSDYSVTEIEKMTVEELRGYPAEQFSELSLQQSKAVPESLLLEKAIQAGDGNIGALLDSADLQTIDQLPWDQIAVDLRASDLNALSESQMSKVPWNRVLTQMPETEFQRLNMEKVFSSMSSEQIDQQDWTQISSMLTQDQISSLSDEQYSRLPWKDMINNLSGTTVRRMTIDDWDRLPESAFVRMNSQTLSQVSPQVLKVFKVSQLQLLPPTTFNGLTTAQARTLAPSTFGRLPIRSLQNVPPVVYREMSAEAFTQMGTKKFSQLNIQSVRSIKKVTITELGGDYSKIYQQFGGTLEPSASSSGRVFIDQSRLQEGAELGALNIAGPARLRRHLITRK